MNIKEIIDEERWGGPGEFEEYGNLGVAHTISLDRIEAAYQKEYAKWQEDEAALMRQVKLWANSCKAAEQRIDELERIIDEIHDTLYGRGFEIIGWHLNGATEPLDRFFESNNWSKDGDA